MESRRSERGVALVTVLLSMMLMTALALALVLATMTETAISANYRDGIEAFYAADAIVEWVVDDLSRMPDPDSILQGLVTSAFVDGAPAGLRTLGGSFMLDLGLETNLVRCGQPAACSDAELTAVTDDRPWGLNNPRWQLYAYGPLARMLPGAIDSSLYVTAWIGDDPLENDDNPLVDGGPTPPGRVPAPNPGSGVLSILAHSYGPGGARRVIEATVARRDGEATFRMLAWRERR
jgi:hypothetical protein